MQVGKIVKSIFPSKDPAAVHDPRIKDLINYARKCELGFFEGADDRVSFLFSFWRKHKKKKI